MPDTRSVMRAIMNTSRPVLYGNPRTLTKNSSNHPAAFGIPGIRKKTINQSRPAATSRVLMIPFVVTVYFLK